MQKKETIIGDSSSDEEEKKQKELFERHSQGRLSNDFKVGAKEGVVQSINLGVATLTNYHEALIKSQGRSHKTFSDKESEESPYKVRKNIFSKSQKKPRGQTLQNLFGSKEKAIGDNDEEEERETYESKKRSTIEIIQEDHDEDTDDNIDRLPQNQKLIFEIYSDMVDRQIFTIINSHFHDIILEEKLEGDVNSIIDSTIRSMLENITKEAHQF